MKDLTEEEKSNFLEWSEGNKYLYDLLCTCGKFEIPTHASCGGHEDEHGKPYLSIIINNDSIPFIESILGQVQDMQNIEVRTSVRHSGNEQLYDDDVLRSLQFSAQKYNCCEMFYKIKKGIESISKDTKLNSKAKKFFGRIMKLNETSREELQDDVDNNIVVGATFSTRTQEFIDYEKSKKLTNASRFMRFFRRLLPIKKDYSKYDELQQKYGFLQREYKEEKIENSKKLEQYRVNNFDNKVNIQQYITKEENLDENER